MDNPEPPPPADAPRQPRAAWLSPRQTAWGIGLLIAAGLAQTAVELLESSSFDGMWFHLFAALDQGAFYAPPLLAGAWAALGPGDPWQRLFLSLVWVSGVGLALAYYYPGTTVGSQVFALTAILQWLCIQIPLTALKLPWGISVARSSANGSVGRPSQGQFRIRHLLTATAIIAVLLGLGRAILRTRGPADLLVDPEPLLVEACIAGVSIVFMTPLILAPMLVRWSMLTSLFVLALICLGTFLEGPALEALLSIQLGYDSWDLFLRNMGQAAWILAFTGVLRLGGYRLTTSK